MTHLTLRIGLTIAAIISILVDCHNDTVDHSDGKLYFTFDIFKVGMLVFIWLI